MLKRSCARGKKEVKYNIMRRETGALGEVERNGELEDLHM